jgi:GDP/UDP-N,N'-diacetylbacillosamine 2-epimerase (hydrolysing)
MKRKICVITGGRSDYGLLKWLMKAIQDDDQLQLQVLATGMHLSQKFGLTISEIEHDGFKVHKKVECLDINDSASGITSSMARTMIGCSEAYLELSPDIVLVLGDRFEIFAAAAAALVANIPVAHLHGGEVTSGAIDESFRHAVTKMSALHFVANDVYRSRVLQMGENPEYVYNVGGLGVDAISNIIPLSKEQLAKDLEVNFLSKSLLITYHPETATIDRTESQIAELLSALARLKDTTLIFTSTNADRGNSIIIELVRRFVAKNKNSYYLESLGQTRYLSILRYVDGVIGNSSSGLTEVPSFKKATINIGERQNGRLEASSIINTVAEESSIYNAIELLYSTDFQEKLPQTINPYGDGGASVKIVQILKDISLDGITKKVFCDI